MISNLPAGYKEEEFCEECGECEQCEQYCACGNEKDIEAVVCSECI